MKFKSLLLSLVFIPAIVFAQVEPKIEAPVAAEVPRAGMPSANVGNVRPAATDTGFHINLLDTTPPLIKEPTSDVSSSNYRLPTGGHTAHIHTYGDLNK